MRQLDEAEWKRERPALAVIYELPVKAFFDSNGDGIGSGLTTVRIGASVLSMRPPRPGDSREVVAAFHSSALRWLPRVFKNLGRGVF